MKDKIKMSSLAREQIKKFARDNCLTQEEIPFNMWSRERILAGKKSCTSRHRRYNDPLVYDVFQTNWGSIKKQDWKTEGADSPEELQKVIESIYHRSVPDDELFYLHLFDNKKMQERLRGLRS